jgi:hypothetical protein
VEPYNTINVDGLKSNHEYTFILDVHDDEDDLDFYSYKFNTQKEAEKIVELKP